RLDIQNDVNNSWVSVFEREREKDRADRRADETGKEQIAPRRDVDLAKLAEIRQEERQKHQQNQDMFPKNDHLGVEQFVQWNAPRALRPPEGRTETDETRTIDQTLAGAIFESNGRLHHPRYRKPDVSSTMFGSLVRR